MAAVFFPKSLASVFTDLDPRAEEKEGRPLRAILGDRLTKAAEQLEGETVGDLLLVADLQNRLGESLLNLGLADSAIQLFAKARATRATSLGADHPDTLTSMGNLADAYRAAGKLDLGLPLAEETLKLMKAKLGADHPAPLASMNNLAMAYQAAGRLAEALPLFEKTLKHMMDKLGPTHPSTLTALSNLAITYLGAKQPEKAIPLLHTYLAIHRRQLVPNDPRLAGMLAQVSRYLLQADQPVEAEKLLRECLAHPREEGTRRLDDIQHQVHARRSTPGPEEVRRGRATAGAGL